MNAQTQTNDSADFAPADKLDATTLASHIGVIVGKLKEAGGDRKTATGKLNKVISDVRNLAIETHAANLPVQAIATAFAGMAKLQQVKAGTVDPYVSAFKGYRIALGEGEAITTGHGREVDGVKAGPMPAATAREFNLDPEIRATNKRVAEVKREIAAAVARAKSDVALLEKVRDTIIALVPSEDEVTTTETATDVNPLADLEALFSEAA